MGNDGFRSSVKFNYEISVHRWWLLERQHVFTSENIESTMLTGFASEISSKQGSFFMDLRSWNITIVHVGSPLSSSCAPLPLSTLLDSFEVLIATATWAQWNSRHGSVQWESYSAKSSNKLSMLISTKHHKYRSFAPNACRSLAHHKPFMDIQKSSLYCC